MTPRVEFTELSGEVEAVTVRRVRHRRAGLSAAVVVGAFALLGVPAVAQASTTPSALQSAAVRSSTITAKALCAGISALKVSSLFGQTVTQLGALNQVGHVSNEICEFAKIKGTSVMGVTMNYDPKGTGTASQNKADLATQKGVSNLVIKSYSSIGGGSTYSFMDTFTSTYGAIKESGMVSYNGSTHYGVIVTTVLPTSSLAKLLQMVVSAA